MHTIHTRSPFSFSFVISPSLLSRSKFIGIRISNTDIRFFLFFLPHTHEHTHTTLVQRRPTQIVKWLWQHNSTTQPPLRRVNTQSERQATWAPGPPLSLRPSLSYWSLNHGFSSVARDQMRAREGAKQGIGRKRRRMCVHIWILEQMAFFGLWQTEEGSLSVITRPISKG